MNIRLAIFDLGNVLFRVDFNRAIAYWSQQSGVSAEVIRDRFDGMYSHLEEFERGALSHDAFFPFLRQCLQVSLSGAILVAGWNSIYCEILPRSYEAIRALAGIMPVVALTNTNSIHCAVWRKRYKKELRPFRKLYVSSEMRMRKPERRIFDRVLNEWNVDPPEAVLFDDHKENLKEVKLIGINAVLVVSDSTVPAWVESYIRQLRCA
jgi:FMN phosphatase YigB (HAD superfamily)